MRVLAIFCLCGILAGASALELAAQDKSKLFKEEKDTTGDGKIDTWSYINNNSKLLVFSPANS